jgi:hypothetical protein
MAPEAIRKSSEYPICPAAPVTATLMGAVMAAICQGWLFRQLQRSRVASADEARIRDEEAAFGKRILSRALLDGGGSTRFL